ncbi:MAG: peptidoglycan DD-metalloendopeptidase family protein [Candidatus Marinimicrobia bacterium]|nr:peptidoglycan DD-metalloendopeptidase family protein [Candidatus Neomarinimicrobiota bacterium]
MNIFHILPLKILPFIFLSLLPGEEKSSKEIQQDIDKRKNELQSLRDDIKDIEERLLLKNKEAISNTEYLIDIESKISLTEKLIRSLNNEENYLSELIQNTETDIIQMESRLTRLKAQLTRRLQYLYVYGRPSVLETVLLAGDWNNAIYRIKYLDILAEYEKKIRLQITETLEELAEEKTKLKIELSRKIALLQEKKREGDTLSADKRKRKYLLSEIKKEKSSLEKSRSVKTRKIAEMESLIKKLYADKEAMKKREEELARIRAEQNRATTGNFAKMKGKLSWPVGGRVIGKFGSNRNPETGTITENVGIDISAQSSTPVKSVLDGVVSTITYIRGHGNVIIIDHGGGFSTVYAHVDNITIHENEYIQMGNSIAKVAEPEPGERAKLHFEVWGNQEKLNPQHWLIKK